MVTARARAAVALRIALAAGGGYALTLLAARAMARLLPMDGREAGYAASLGAWPVFVAAAIWCFAARSLAGALLPLVIAAIVLKVLAG